jgi:hypothetical protein
MRATFLALSLSTVGRYDFEATQLAPPPGSTAPAPQPDGLSGITWLGHTKYLAVSDRHAFLFPLTIRVDSLSGAILDASLDEPIPLLDRDGAAFNDTLEGPDREDIAWDAATRSVWIANERSGGTRTRPSLARHLLATGRMTQFISATKKSPLAIFQTIQVNQGFESITRAADGHETWTANEGSLYADGAPHDDGGPRVVRLVRFDAKMAVSAEYAYVTDPPEGTITFPPGAESHRNFGVSDLLLLDDGTLLSLERALTAEANGFARFTVRIYAIDLAGATDVSRPPYAGGLAAFHVAGLPGATGDAVFTPARKERLLEINSPLLSVGNFEGMTLGPKLAGGDRSVILIGDNDNGRREALYALRLRR